MKKIVLINPSSGKFSLMGYGIYPPLGLAYLSAHLKKQGYNSYIIDAHAEMLDLDKIILKIKEYNPFLIGLTATTPMIPHALKIAKKIKDQFSNVYIVIGGNHVFHCYEEVLKENKYVDFVIRGEGEFTLVELVKYLDIKDRQIEKINGLVFRDQDKIIINSERKPIEDLDILEFPDYDALPMKKYKAIRMLGGGYKFASPIAFRGCPFNCKYCATFAEWKGKVRGRSPQNLIKEIEFLQKKYDIKTIRFADDMMTMKKDWMREFCSLIKEKKIKLKWACYGRVETVNGEMLKDMKSVGCAGIFYGIEFGSERVRKLVNKNFSNDIVKKAVLAAKKAKIPVYGLFMIGYPGETEKEIYQTIDFAIELDVDWASFFVITPMPGTDFFNEMKCANKIKSYDWNLYDINNDFWLLKHDTLSEQDILRLKKIAFKKFYMRPKYFLKRLININSFKDIYFGLKYLLFRK